MELLGVLEECQCSIATLVFFEGGSIFDVVHWQLALVSGCHFRVDLVAGEKDGRIVRASEFDTWGTALSLYSTASERS